MDCHLRTNTCETISNSQIQGNRYALLRRLSFPGSMRRVSQDTTNSKVFKHTQSQGVTISRPKPLTPRLDTKPPLSPKQEDDEKRSGLHHFTLRRQSSTLRSRPASKIPVVWKEINLATLGLDRDDSISTLSLSLGDQDQDQGERDSSRSSVGSASKDLVLVNLDRDSQLLTSVTLDYGCDFAPKTPLSDDSLDSEGDSEEDYGIVYTTGTDNRRINYVGLGLHLEPLTPTPTLVNLPLSAVETSEKLENEESEKLADFADSDCLDLDVETALPRICVTSPTETSGISLHHGQPNEYTLSTFRLVTTSTSSPPNGDASGSTSNSDSGLGSPSLACDPSADADSDADSILSTLSTLQEADGSFRLPLGFHDNLEAMQRLIEEHSQTQVRSFPRESAAYVVDQTQDQEDPGVPRILLTPAPALEGDLDAQDVYFDSVGNGDLSETFRSDMTSCYDVPWNTAVEEGDSPLTPSPSYDLEGSPEHETELESRLDLLQIPPTDFRGRLITYGSRYWEPTPVSPAPSLQDIQVYSRSRPALSPDERMERRKRLATRLAAATNIRVKKWIEKVLNRRL